MKSNRLRMSNSVFRVILIPVMAIFLALAIVAPIVSEYYATSLDTYIGRGKLVYDTASGGAQYDLKDTAYYDQPFKAIAAQNGTSEKTEASYNGYKVGEQISDEGEVLLKNDGVLPLAKQEKVTPLGYRYVDPVMTGTGSGAATLLQNFVVTPKLALQEYFEVNKEMENVLSQASVRYATSSGYKSKSDENGTFSGATSSVGEFNSSIYNSSMIGDYKTGLVFIGRQGGEGGDLQTTPYFDGTSLIALHQLQLMPDEKNMIFADFLSVWVLKKSGKEIVVINPQGIRIEGRKGQGEIKKETIHKITFQTNLVSKCCLIQISTGSSQPIAVDDVAIPEGDVERVEKACKAMLGLQ